MCRDVSNMNVNDEEEVRFLVMYEDLHRLNAWQWKVKCFPTAGLRIVTAACRSLEIRFHLLRLIIHRCSVEQLWKHLSLHRKKFSGFPRQWGNIVFTIRIF